MQDSPWYHDFLQDTILEIKATAKLRFVLDIGCGPGKLLELIAKDSNIDCRGVDTNPFMLRYARQRPGLSQSVFYQNKPGEDLAFPGLKFDVISFCSVLFLLDEPKQLLQNAFSMLRQYGKIVILTPTGKGNPLSYFPKILNYRNYGFWIWRYATRHKALKWKRQNIIQDFCIENSLSYQQRRVFHNFAQIETIRFK